MNKKAFFELELAKSVGRTPATLIERLKYWLSFSELTYEGKTYCFRTLEQLAEEVGVSVSTVKRAVKKLVSLGYIVKQKLKSKRWNQVNCYTLGERFERKNEAFDRADQTDPSEPTKEADSAQSSKKNFILGKIKEVRRVVQNSRGSAKGFGSRAFNGSQPVSSCLACHGSGILSDSDNVGYRCHCSAGKSLSQGIPQASEALYLLLKTQLGLGAVAAAF